MKKILYSFLIVLSTSALSNAQSYLQFSFVLLDVNQDTVSTGGLQMVSNSDSSTAGIAFYRFYSSPKIGYHNDSLLIDSAYQGDSVTFYYYDCTGWHYFDTVFTANQLLTVRLQTGCQSMCNASFSFYGAPSKLASFAAINYSSSYTHYWNFGNGQTSQSGASQSIQYTTAGSYLVTHVLRNPGAGCYDSVSYYILVMDSCHADFTYSTDSNTTVDFYGVNTSTTSNGFWYFGDGTTTSGDSVTHTYASKANYLVSYVVQGIGCKDSVAKLVEVNTAQSSLNFKIVFLDANQDTMQVGGLLIVTNSDSATAGVGFYRYYPNPQPGFQSDQLYIDSLYLGDSVSFYYEDCNGWHTFDTVFIANQLLEVTIQTGCQNPCDADFTSYISPGKTGSFYAPAYSSAYWHYWNFGNGVTSQTGGGQNTQYTSAGTYLVYHITGNSNIGCFDSSAQYITVYDSCHADFSYTMDSNTTVSFVGIYYPSTSSGFWYFGDGYMDTGNSVMHTYPSKSNYTVSYVVSGPGCSDSVSKMVYVNTSQTCDSRFSVSHVADFQKRFVRTDSSHGYSKWYINNNFVGNGHSHNYTASQEGNYKVTLNVVDSANNVLCSRDDFFYLNFCGKPYAQAYAYGQVLFNGNLRMDYDSLKIYLISHDTAQGLLTLVDSAILTNADTGKFWFDICEPNQLFLVKAALLPGSSLYSSFIPTYYDSSLYWSVAKSFYGASYLANGVINMIAGTNPGGPGFIGGYVTQGANKKDEPLEDIQVLLLTDQGIPVASVFTHDGGRFEFNNLAYGKYYLTVEFPGKNSATHFITLSADNETTDNNNFEVNSTYISAINPNSIPKIHAASGFYPNPANDQLFIKWTGDADENLLIEFYTLDGKRMKATDVERNGEMTSEIQIGDLPSGFYILKVTGAETTSTLRLQKY